MSRCFTVLFLLLFVLMLSGCIPKYATKGQVIEYVNNEVYGERVELVANPESHEYVFSSLDRDLRFEAGTYANKIYIDGSDFGYSGSYSISSDYMDKVYSLYTDEIYDLLEKYGFTDYKTSNTCDYIKNFCFCIRKDYMSSDLDDLNLFLEDLRDIVRRENKFHPAEGYNGNSMFTYEVYWQSGDKDYIRTAGYMEHSYGSDIITEGASTDVRDIPWSDMHTSNVIPPVNNGMLVYVPARTDEEILDKP